MPRLTKIYTKSGDKGETSLGTTERVSKASPRVQAYGDVDELNSMIGVVIASGVHKPLVGPLTRIQNELFVLGSDLAFPQDANKEIEVPRIQERHVVSLEQLIDKFWEESGSLANFILPGGSLSASLLQLARAVCRRAERSLVELSKVEAVGDHSVQYLNRLSDALFMMARMENTSKGIDEPLWNPHV